MELSKQLNCLLLPLISSILTFFGMASKQPVLTYLGLMMSPKITATAPQKSKEKNPLSELEKQCQTLQKKLEKIDQKVSNHDTQHRLRLGAIQKLQHQQKCLQSQLQDITNTDNSPKKTKGKTKPLTLAKSPLLIAQQPSIEHIFIDGANLEKGAKKLGIRIDYQALKIVLGEKAQRVKFYYYNGTKSPEFIHILQNLGYQVTILPISDFSGKRKIIGDDVALALDIIKEVKQGDGLTLVSGDGDYLPVVEEMKNQAIPLTVVAHPQMLNHRLHSIADHFISLTAISDEIAV